MQKLVRTTTAGDEHRGEVPAGRRAAVDWALSQVGITQPTFGRNARIDTWQREFGLQDVDWCGCFVGYALRVAGGVEGIDGRVVWVPCVLADARSGLHGWARLAVPHEASRGDVALYCWDDSGVPSHTGLVVANHPDEHAISTVEGNTTSGDHGDQSRGGGVFLRKRSYGRVVACAVPGYR